MIHRRRSLLLKLVISGVLLWLSFVLFIGTGDILRENRYRRDGHVQSQHTNWQHNLQAVDLSRPDAHGLRFEVAVIKGEEEEEEVRRQKEEQEDEMHLENRRKEMIHDRDVPPFVNMQMNSATRSTPAPVVNDIDLSSVDNVTRRLIEKGLLIPKWNLERETPGTPNGTGKEPLASLLNS